MDTSANINSVERNCSLGYCHSSVDASVLPLQGRGEREIKSARNDEKEKRVSRSRFCLVTQRWGRDKNSCMGPYLTASSQTNTSDCSWTKPSCSQHPS